MPDRCLNFQPVAGNDDVYIIYVQDILKKHQSFHMMPIIVKMNKTRTKSTLPLRPVHRMIFPIYNFETLKESIVIPIFTKFKQTKQCVLKK